MIIMPRCPETGKASFRSKEDARAWLIRQPKIEKMPDRIYICPGCEYWHFTGSHNWTSRSIERRRNYGRRETAARRSRKRKGK
jgi:hypothetical protein